MNGDIAPLQAGVHERLGPSCVAWPGGWPGEIEVAIIDAVLSVRTHHGRRASAQTLARAWWGPSIGAVPPGGGGAAE